MVKDGMWWREAGMESKSYDTRASDFTLCSQITPAAAAWSSYRRLLLLQCTRPHFWIGQWAGATAFRSNSLVALKNFVLQGLLVLIDVNGLDHSDNDRAVIERIMGRLCDICRKGSDLRSIVLTGPTHVKLSAGSRRSLQGGKYSIRESPWLWTERNWSIYQVYIVPIKWARCHLAANYWKKYRLVLRGDFFDPSLELTDSYSNVLHIVGKIASSLTGLWQV